MESGMLIALEMNKRNNIDHMGVHIGTVQKGFPDIEIKPDDCDLKIYYKENLIFGSSILKNHKRKFSITGHLKFDDSSCGSTTPVNDGGMGASSHSHQISTLNVDTTYQSEGEVVYTDTIEIGHKVILIPTKDEQVYYVLDWGVSL
ncbi:DUF2577 domain-containing protein [Brevibacillus laterosporus]|nr:DUF2577 family protein [Brevibacillus laterosporus]TPG71173.1 DUF2577 domain-containing protein [Brevibacillus laterosporus]